MWAKFVKGMEWIGHASTAWQVAGWFGLTTAGIAGWAVTFFGSAAEGYSVTAVWLSSLAAGALVAAIYAAITVGLAYRRARDALPAETRRGAANSGRVPITTLRTWAEAAGWCRDVQSVTVGDNDWWTFSIRLRQAGVDGVIQFWGRRYVHGWMDKDTDSTPLVKIPSDHFEHFDFDCTRLAQCENYDIFTTQLGDPPSAFLGQNYRDVYVDAAQARLWLEGAGAPPPSADFHVTLDTSAALLGNLTTAVALRITGLTDLDDCSASIEQITRRGERMPIPLVLRTDGQIRDNRKGRWRLSRNQPKTVPIFFSTPNRRNEWFFFHETGEKYFLPAGRLSLLVGVYGGKMDGKVLLTVEVGDGWRVYPSIKTVDEHYELETEAQST
jgi:hypothetical protein